MSAYVTLTGVTLAELPAALDQLLPAEAYTAVPGGADLTDIDPNWMRKVFTQVFGLCGLGWGYEYQAGDIKADYTGKEGQREREATLTRLEFWYVLVDAGGNSLRCAIPASGGSENKNAAYSLKGAITNAIGNAASNLGWQESVYLGRRSHKTVKASSANAAPKPAPAKPAAPQAAPAPAPAPQPVAENPLAQPLAPAPAKPASNGNGHHKPAAAPAVAPAVLAVAAIEDLDEPAPPASYADFVIPTGKHAGKRLGEMSQEWLAWAANQMKPTDEATQKLKAAVQAYLSQTG